ncbi:MAG: S8 family serine peptidase [Cytophagales bacterium]|nr:S8 family serine peptidase [Cytophagales bacterium]
MNKFFLFFLLYLTIESLSAQTEKYFIFFKDKPVHDSLFQNPSSFLSEKAIERRERFNISIDTTDLPVNPSYVNSLQTLGINVWYTSHWLNGAYVSLNKQQLDTLSYFSFVKEYEAMESALAGGIMLDSTDYSNTFAQNKSIGITSMHQDDLTGKGISIAIFDSGFENTDQYLSEVDVSHTFDFVDNETDVYDDHDHGTQVLSILGAYQESSFIGSAYDANYFLYRTENIYSEYRIEEYNWLLAAEKADSLGVDIISNSLGYFDFDNPSQNYTQSDIGTEIALITKAAKWASEKGILVVTSVGNEGNGYWKNITFPSDAKGVLSVGAVNQEGVPANFTAYGFVTDSLTKPNVVAYGVQTKVINSRGNIASKNGTSYATPLVAGLVAGLMEEYPLVSPLEWIELIEKSSSHYLAPTSRIGYGIPDYQILRQEIEKEIVSIVPNSLLVYPTLIYNEEQLTIRSNFVADLMYIQVADVLGRVYLEGLYDYQKALEIPVVSDMPNTLIVKCWVNNQSFSQRVFLLKD